MIDPLAWIDEEASSWSARGLARRLVPHGKTVPGRFERDGRSLINFGSNDYLGLAADPRLAAAARASAENYGWGAGASPLVAGWTVDHQTLTDSLADFEGVEAALLFPTGFAANLGTLAALVGKPDIVYSDRLNHACLIDGARLSGAQVRIYPHGDVETLADLLERDRGRFRRSLIATDGVFSMDGDLAPLPALVEVAEHFAAILMVDEAHGTGVFGPDGRGASSALGVADRVPVRVGTLSKALGSQGGFVAGSRRLVDWLINHARAQIYSTSLPPATVAAATAALAIVQAEPWRRTRLHDLGKRLRKALTAAHFDLGPSPSTGPIIPVVVGDPREALDLSLRLLDSGMFVPAIRPPTVPDGTSRLRISLSAAHADADLDALIDALITSPATTRSSPGKPA
ncbi:MAG: 8-amino-7-oxononanoate synthase [Isosphaeraceae bacterium]